MGLARGCALLGDRISSSSSCCVLCVVCVCVCTRALVCVSKFSNRVALIIASHRIRMYVDQEHLS